MSEGEKSRKVRKTGSPKVVKRPEAGSMKPEDIKEETKSEIANPKSEIKMEVHHHPEVEKKGLKEYVLEGLMIFLAVTMGFIAENIREGISDRHKEAEYARSLVDDLKKDTTAMHYSIRRLNANLTSGKKMIELYADGKLTTLPDTTILRLSLTSGLSVDIIFNDRTSSQLKGTGSMRLFTKKEVADSILQYWNNQKSIEQVHDRFETTREEHRRIGYKLFNWYYFYYQNVNKKSPGSALWQVKKAILDDKMLPEFINVTANLYNTGASQYSLRLKMQLSLAEKLITLINTKYGSENE
jgi:hypothetical protein